LPPQGDKRHSRDRLGESYQMWCLVRLPFFVMGYELRVMSYELRVMSYAIRV